MSAFDYFWTHPKAMKEFNDSMTSSSAFSNEAVLNSYHFSTVSRLVDVGGGQGLLLASILKKYPHMKGILLDVPAVVEEAREIINSYGVAERCERMGGNFFESVPAGDAYIMKFILILGRQGLNLKEFPTSFSFQKKTLYCLARMLLILNHSDSPSLLILNLIF